MAKFTKISLLVLCIALTLIACTPVVDDLPSEEIDPPDIIFSASSLYHDYLDVDSLEQGETVTFTPSADNTFGFFGGKFHFALTNNTDEDMTITSAGISITNIELDEAEACFVTHMTENMMNYEINEHGGNLLVRIVNSGFGLLSAGTLEVRIPDEYRDFFFNPVYQVSIEALEPGDSQIGILIAETDIALFPEDIVDIVLNWQYQTEQTTFHANASYEQINSYKLSEPIKIRLNAEGMCANSGAFGLEDGPVFVVDPLNTEREFSVQTEIIIPAKSTIGLFSSLGAHKSCFLEAKIFLELEDGTIIYSEPYEARFIQPLLKKEQATIVSDTNIRDYYYSFGLFQVVSPLDLDLIQVK